MGAEGVFVWSISNVPAGNSQDNRLDRIRTGVVRERETKTLPPTIIMCSVPAEPLSPQTVDRPSARGQGRTTRRGKLLPNAWNRVI